MHRARRRLRPGTTSGSAAVPWMTRPRTRSYSRDVPVSVTPAPMTAPRPDEDALEQGAARPDERVVLDDDRPGAGRLEDATDRHAGAEMDPRPDLGARPDEHVRVDHRPVADPRADVDVRRRHDDDVRRRDGRRGGWRCRRGRSAMARRRGRRVAGRRPGRGRSAARPSSRARPVREAGEDRRLDLRPDAPAAGRRRVGFGGPDPAGLEVGEDRLGIDRRSARPVGRADRLGSRRCDAVMPLPRASRDVGEDPAAGRPRPARGRAAWRPSRPARPGRAGGAARGPCRSRAGPSAAARP